MEKAQAVAASLNAALRQKRYDSTSEATDADAARRRDPDATDFHATIPINDYPQKARWRVTNKETMVQLIENTGASVTNKGMPVCFFFFLFLSRGFLTKNKFRRLLREG
jgi:ATP-dependent RNA helicase DDX46/PRP5